jgi:uncharacterized protein
MKCQVMAKTRLFPTEDLEKIITAISNIFDYDDIEIGENYVCASGDVKSMIRLRESLKKRRIRLAARKMMIKKSSKNIVNFYLSKQAAFGGIANLVDEDLSSLGEIEVKVKTDNINKFIDWLAPKAE